MNYKIRWSTGATETCATYDEALARVRAVLSAPVIGHSGDISEGGRSTLVWASKTLATTTAAAQRHASWSAASRRRRAGRTGRGSTPRARVEVWRWQARQSVCSMCSGTLRPLGTRTRARWATGRRHTARAARRTPPCRADRALYGGVDPFEHFSPERDPWIVGVEQQE